GKALVVRCSHESKNARPAEILVVRQTGKPLSLVQRFQADAKNGKGDDVLLLNVQSVLPPRCAPRGAVARSGLPGSWHLSRDNEAVLEASFAEDPSDTALEMIRPLDASFQVDSIGPWFLLSSASAAGGEARAESGSSEDPQAALARCSPPTTI